MSTKIPMLPPFKMRQCLGMLSTPQDYNVKLLNVPEIWKETKGAGVKVVVLDTGRPQHRDLIVKGSTSFIESPSISDMYLFDINGHGTHCAGVVAAYGGPDGKGILGIAPEAELWTCTVMDENGYGSIEATVKGIRWAVDTVQAQVLSLSLGIDNAPLIVELEQACQYAESKGVTVVVAAGNSGGPLGQPAIYSSVVAVAAVNSAKQRAAFSSYGKDVDFASGGVDIWSTWLGNQYACLSGTSMATPSIAGVAVLLIAREFKRTGRYLNSDEVVAQLKDLAVDVDVPGWDERTGYGVPVFKNSGGSGKPPRVKAEGFFKKLLRYFGLL